MLKWCESYIIGIEEIDLEHKEIIDNFEKLYLEMKTGRGHDYCKELIEFLERYVDKHFSNEERFQLKTGFKKHNEHKKIHDAFRDKVKQDIGKLKDTEITDEELLKINIFIKDWLVNHILNVDKEIAITIDVKDK